ncbi:MAG: V-type ATPase subunit [Treponema sp.]|jgi:vacuolar-type H+-ATPase subunit C/Vma6|nr:V-type ATPase subunit [Treponema sp.]
MPGTGERAYVYAKACGIIGKSFVGRRIPALAGCSRLSELDRLIFSQGSRDLPERELLKDLENRIIGRSAKEILAIIGSFSRPPEFLSLLIRSYEYSDVKAALKALSAREKAPGFIDIGPFRTVHFEAWPDRKAMFGGTEFEFLLREKNEDPMFLQAELDRLYYNKLWKSLLALRRNDRIAAGRILSEEIRLRNSVWVLRLRSYYGMKAADLRRHLLEIDLKGESLADEALAILDTPLDSRQAWQDWPRESFLNPERAGEPWTADPRFFQNTASEYLYELAKKNFRRKPFSLDTVFCFIKLKQFEEDVLTSVAEGLSLGMSSRDVFSLLEVSPS